MYRICHSWIVKSVWSQIASDLQNYTILWPEMAPSPSIHPSIQPLGSSNPQDFRRFSDDRLQGTSFFGNNRNHWKVRNHANVPPKGSYVLQLANMNPMFCVVCMYCNLVLEIFRSPRLNDFWKGKATSKCRWYIPKVDIFKSPLWHENYPFVLGGQGRKQFQHQKKIHQKMAPKKRVLGVGNPTTFPLLCFPKVGVVPVTSKPLSFCYMVSSAQPGDVISPISLFSKDGCSWPPEMEKPRYNFHVPPRYLRHVSPGHLGFHKVFGHWWGEPVTWLRSKMCLFFKIKG